MIMIELINTYWYEFVMIASAHLLAVISPGADFAVVSKQALDYGRRCAVYTILFIWL